MINLQSAMAGNGVSGVGAASAERLLADVRGLAPSITARRAEIETARRMPLDLVEALRSIGIFRMTVPRSHDGLELDLPAVLDVLAALGRIDGSVAWIAMIAAGIAAIMTMRPREVYDRIYQDGPDVIFAGVAVPGGTARPAGGGWCVTGRWPFASGCQHADSILAFCVMTRDGIPLPGPAPGVPLVQSFYLPANQWQIEDTWYAAGLKGTGSHHVALNNVLIPAENFGDVVGGAPCVPGPLYHGGMMQHLPAFCLAAVSLGMAEGALDEIVQLAQTGRTQVRAARPMRDSEMFQGELGRVEAELRAARAYLEVQAAIHWRRAVTGTLADDPRLRQQASQVGIWVTDTSVGAADACFALAGGSAVYETSPLQHRLRDLHVAAQNSFGQQRHYAEAGELLLNLFPSSSSDA